MRTIIVTERLTLDRECNKDDVKHYFSFGDDVEIVHDGLLIKAVKRDGSFQFVSPCDYAEVI